MCFSANTLYKSYINPCDFSRFKTGRRLTPSRHACALVTYAKCNVELVVSYMCFVHLSDSLAYQIPIANADIYKYSIPPDHSAKGA